jgi:hypothetical protein
MSKDAIRDAQALRLSIGRREEQLQTALSELVRAAEARASLGHYIARYPWHFLIGGLVLGAWLGRRRSRRRS